MARSGRAPAAVIVPVYVNGTTLVQELGARGAHVVAVDARPDAIGFASRYAREKVLLPGLKTDSGAFASWLLSREDLHGALVVPTEDFQVREIAERYDELAPLFRLAVAPPEATLAALNKDRTYAAVERLGLPVPRGVPLGEGVTLDEAAAFIGFPAILKPRFGVAFQRDFRTKVFIVRDAAELSAAFERAAAAGHAVIMQEIVPGPNENLGMLRGYVSDSGEVTHQLTSVKLTSYPPEFGIGQVHESRDLPEIVGPTLDLLRSIGYRGALFGAEWKLDARTGQWKFIELNSRSMMSIGMMKYCGVDAIDAMWRDKMGLPPGKPTKARWGRRYAHLRNGISLHFGYPDARPRLGDYLRIYRPPVKLDLLCPGDMKPFLADLRPVFGRRFAWLRSRAPGTASSDKS